MEKATPLRIVFLSFLVRIAFLLYTCWAADSTAVFLRPDTPPYLDLARELLSSGSFSINHTTELFRTPAYPVFLIPGLLSGHVEITTALFQILLSCWTVYLVYKTANFIFNDETAARAASLLYALEQLSIVYSLILLTETLFSFIFMWFILFVVKLLKTPSLRYAALAGIFAALGAYIRPVALYLPAVIVIFLLIYIFFSGTFKEKKRLFLNLAALLFVSLSIAGIWQNVSIAVLICLVMYIFFSEMEKEKKRLILNLVVLLLVSISVTGIWQVRNLKETGYMRFSSISDFNLYFYHRISVIAKKEKRPFYHVKYEDEQNFKILVKEKGFNYAESLVYMRHESFKTIKENLDIFIPIYAGGLAAVLFSPGATEYAELFSYKGKTDIFGATLDSSFVNVLKGAVSDAPLLFIASIFLGLMIVLYYVLMLAAIVNIKKLDLIFFFMFLLLAYFLLVSGGLAGYGRFRQPMMPIVSIFGGYGVVLILDRIKNSATLK